MKKLITYRGKIQFDPENITKKHLNQADWKRMALIMFDGDLAEYYAWFIFKRYGLKLNKPLRGAHISFINDSMRDIKSGLKTDSDKYANKVWNDVRKKWDNKEIDVVLNLNARSDFKYWWLIVDHDYRKPIHDIRKELGLGRPYFGLHMTVGYANDKNLKNSEYIVRSATRFEYPVADFI